MAGEAAVFAHSLMLCGGQNSAVSPPEVAVANALLIALGYGVPEQLTGGFTPSTDDARHHLPGVFAQS